jgi:hypothetical protein
MPWTESDTVLSADKSVVINAQDALRLSGYQPFLTLIDLNANNLRASVQSANGRLFFLPQSALNAGGATVVFNSLDAAAGQLNPSAVEIHAQDGVLVVGYEPFITLGDANAGYAKARIQTANGDLVFWTQAALAGGTPAMTLESATGNVHVSGALTADKDLIVAGADLAENFDLVDPSLADPGTVMVLDGVDHVHVSESAYDRRVVGVVSGAGHYRPGVVLDYKADHASTRRALAMVGKTFCKIDASFGSVEVGDLLTTSPTPGYAMKASEPSRAYGAVLGKAMASLSEGQGLLPIVVTLQ